MLGKLGMMGSDTILAVAAAVAIAALVLWLIARRSSPQYHNLPPGPGPAVAIPTQYPWRHFHDLSRTYGPVVTVWANGRPTVIVNSVDAALFFMEKNARDTADRPSNLVADEIFSHGKRTLLVGHNERWRRLRRALHHPLQPSSARDLRDVQERLASTVVRDLLHSPARFQDHIQTYAASLVVYMAYGRRTPARYSDPDIRKVVDGGKHLGILLRPGNYALFNTNRWLQYVPGTLRTVHAWAAEELALYRSQLADVQRRVATDPTSVAPCFGTYLLENKAKFELEDDDIAYLLGSVFGAGSDTSSSAISIVVMAAATHLAEQKAVQAELDRLCGSSPPTFNDLQEAHLLQAFIAETFRWRPVSSGGFAHQTTAQVQYNGLSVPAGTSIMGNHWGIHRDAEYYGADVEAFRPSRWMREDGTEFNEKMKHFQFGFGRRVCPGQHVANNSVLINAALMLWAFDIRPEVDPSGNEVPIDTLAFTNTANSHPLPFKASFTPRVANLDAVLGHGEH
ncbi:Cytochrome P450 monooxygenase yanC [Vanrija pseudolonga]|uniref:Cytochrome P450 monooxygenase yanC n=1 Tax=Vanrija pseudolonga TaxID=143232 RepID=A0AAF1BKP4_9TREE|nr:Cytochrome P450 monooxygenase yanC [Vanrija pseudolonga]